MQKFYKKNITFRINLYFGIRLILQMPNIFSAYNVSLQFTKRLFFIDLTLHFSDIN